MLIKNIHIYYIESERVYKLQISITIIGILIPLTIK